MLVGCGKEEEKEKEYFRFKDEIVTIYVGETYEIEYETNIKNPDIKVDDEEIASIEGNVATGLSRGYASIYVEVNGETIYEALDGAVDRIESQIKRHKNKLAKAIKHREGVSGHYQNELNVKEDNEDEVTKLFKEKKIFRN